MNIGSVNYERGINSLFENLTFFLFLKDSKGID
jgi:hypothetical protein